MSCLPEIFQVSKSQNLPPNKQAAAFSIHLRSSHFQPKTSLLSDTPHRNYESSDRKRYKSWMDSEVPFRSTRRSSRSYFYKESGSKDRVVEERGHSCQNINSRSTLQSQVEAISSFNATKHNAIEAMHLMSRSLEVLGAEQSKVKKDLQNLEMNLIADVESFHTNFSVQLTTVLKTFRNEKRLAMTSAKAINSQLQHLGSELGTCGGLANELETTFQKMTSQFH